MEEGSIARAASRNHIAPSALSRPWRIWKRRWGCLRLSGRRRASN
ncbi:LysR family transcriptional regulator [Paraburkholderia sp. CNPSo 3274]|nr:LysR family transcriptional regulator [Paraburkholderia sp. CNPSo 3274]